jgi:acyl-CoA-binding protein
MAAKIEGIEEKFRLASSVIKKERNLKLSNEDKLKLYALFKQVNELNEISV